MNPLDTPSEVYILLTEAAWFAARMHAGQRRKGARAAPYVNHVIEVARLLAALPAGFDLNLVVAGFLHDAIEDTSATRDDIAARFGEDVAALVVEVTDDKTLPRSVRKQLQIENAPALSPRAQNLSAADKISNLRSTLDDPPVGWSTERQRDYFEWAKAVIDRFPALDPALRDEFDWTYARFPAVAAAAAAG